MSKITPSTGMPGHKLIKKRPITDSALQGKPKPTIKSPNPPKSKDKLELKCKKKAFSLTNVLTSSSIPVCTSTVRCGKKGATKQLCTFRD